VARKVKSEDARVIELILADGRMIPVDTDALCRQREWLTHADNPGSGPVGRRASCIRSDLFAPICRIFSIWRQVKISIHP
jgi:hypothetical protein